MGSFSIWHWLIVLLIVVLVFGTKKLRNIGSDLGGAVKEFKEAVSDVKNSEGKKPELNDDVKSNIVEGEVTHKTKQ